MFAVKLFSKFILDLRKDHTKNGLQDLSNVFFLMFLSALTVLSSRSIALSGVKTFF